MKFNRVQKATGRKPSSVVIGLPSKEKNMMDIKKDPSGGQRRIRESQFKRWVEDKEYPTSGHNIANNRDDIREGLTKNGLPD